MTAKDSAIFYRIFLFFMLIALSGLSVYGGERIMNKEECLKKYQITRDTSPWLGFTSSHTEEEESKKISAVTLAGSEFKPIPSLAKYSVSGRFIIGRSDNLHRIAVERSLFSELKRGDATRNTEVRFLIGKYKDTSFRIMKPAELAGFLIESQIINTYWHVESDFCLIAENETEYVYTADYRGEHIYFTNSENREPLDFSIIIDKKSGEIFLEAR